MKTERLEGLKRQHRMLLPTLRALADKRHKGRITDAELYKLLNIENLYNENSYQILEEKKSLISEMYGVIVLEKWLELEKIRGTSFITSSETGKRFRDLELELSEVNKFINSVN